MTGPRPAEPTREILTIDEAAALLGVSSKTFAKVLREGHLPGRKVGREWKFSRHALIAWVAAGRTADYLDGHDADDGAAAGDGAQDASSLLAPRMRALEDGRRPGLDGVMRHRGPAPRAERPRRPETESFIEED